MKQYITTPGVDWSRSILSSSIMLHDCPKCGAKAGYYCFTKSNSKVWPPHGHRISCLTSNERDNCKITPMRF